MKRIVLITALLFSSGLAGSAQSNYLHVSTDKGWEVIDLAQADHLTFNAGTMMVSDASGNAIASYPQASLNIMYVDQNTGVGTIFSENTESSFKVSGDGRSVELSGKGTFEVFEFDGTLLVAIPDATPGKTVTLSGLKPGIYVYRLGRYSMKHRVN